MAKIYAKSKDYSGISATVEFKNGVGVTNDAHLLSFFKENGYFVVDLPNMNYKELCEYARMINFNPFGYKKDELLDKLAEMEG